MATLTVLRVSGGVTTSRQVTGESIWLILSTINSSYKTSVDGFLEFHTSHYCIQN